MSKFFARQIPFATSPISIMNQGTGTGKIIIAALHEVPVGSKVSDVILIDGIPAIFAIGIDAIAANFQSFRALKDTDPDKVFSKFLRGVEPMYFILDDISAVEASAPDLIVAERFFSTLLA